MSWGYRNFVSVLEVDLQRNKILVNKKIVDDL